MTSKHLLTANTNTLKYLGYVYMYTCDFFVVFLACIAMLNVVTLLCEAIAYQFDVFIVLTVYPPSIP